MLWEQRAIARSRRSHRIPLATEPAGANNPAMVNPQDYISELDVTARWPMLKAKELRKARRKQLIEFYSFRDGPCYTAEQVQGYIDRTYLKGAACAAPSRSQPNPPPSSPETTPSKLEGSISAARTLTEAGSSMPTGMTPELALSAVEHLAQRIGKRQKLSSLPSSFPPRPPKTGQSPVLIKS